MKRAKASTQMIRRSQPVTYAAILTDVVRLLENARRTSARAINAVMTSTYWTIGQRIVEEEQNGRGRADYGDELITRLSSDLTTQFGRGFGRRNLFQIRSFYLAYREIVQTPSALLGDPAASIATRFPLPWSHYVGLLAVAKTEARQFYEAEAIRGGWSVRQLRRQVDSQFYERMALSRNKAAILKKGQLAKPEDAVAAEEELREPVLLEFLGLKDEYSESDLEEGLIQHLEHFLLELGSDFAFIGRQRRLRIDDEWYRVDLLFFHRRLRCLVIIDLKLGKFTHADAGQMHLYLNYAAQHWTNEGENPPVGIILCATKGESLVRYATDNLSTKVLVREYLTTLPDEKLIAQELDKTRRMLEQLASGAKARLV